MDEIISYKMCAVKVRNAKLRNYLSHKFAEIYRDLGGISLDHNLSKGRCETHSNNKKLIIYLF
jgi:hypothetical protein